MELVQKHRRILRAYVGRGTKFTYEGLVDKGVTRWSLANQTFKIPKWDDDDPDEKHFMHNVTIDVSDKIHVMCCWRDKKAIPHEKFDVAWSFYLDEEIPDTSPVCST